MHKGAPDELATWHDIHRAAKAIIEQCVRRTGGIAGDFPKIGKSCLIEYLQTPDNGQLTEYVTLSRR